MTDDLRRTPRVLLDCDVEISHGETKLHGQAHDISVGGMFIRTAEQVPFGAKVDLRFRIPSAPAELTLSGVVRWTRPDGMGIQFGAFGVRETFAITEWVKKHGGA
jgi:type IV pilus assembly protein PilZ